MFPRISIADDAADRGLVESLVAVVSLQKFQVRAHGSARSKMIRLFGCDVTFVQCRLEPSLVDRPHFSFGEALLEEIEIGKRRHRSDPALAKLSASGGEIELRYTIAHDRDQLLHNKPAAFAIDLAAVKRQDRQQVAHLKPAPAYLSPKAKQIYQRTLLLLGQMQDPDGGIIAAPEFDFDYELKISILVTFQVNHFLIKETKEYTQLYPTV